MSWPPSGISRKIRRSPWRPSSGSTSGSWGAISSSSGWGSASSSNTGPRDPETDVSGDDPIVTGKIALAHLTEFPDYYTRLAVLEREAADHLKTRK